MDEISTVVKAPDISHSSESTIETVPLAKAASYYKRGIEPANRAIQSFLYDSPLIVHGSRAINAWLPSWLDRETKDWDILAKTDVEKLARILERKLDNRYGGDYFAVEAAVHPGTFRIRNKVTGEVIADLTLQERQVTFQSLRHIKYATLLDQENHILETLNDPSAAYRHRKDTEALQRIRLFKKIKKRKARQRRRRWDDDGYGALAGLTRL